MNNITEKLSEIFNEKQIQAMKDAWRYGQWGDCEILFNGENENSWALGACTNDIKVAKHFTGRQISGIMSGISKKIAETKTNLVENIPNWWGDGTGDMIFFNYEAFEFENSSIAWDAFNEWSKSND